jgi:hypothetical protein
LVTEKNIQVKQFNGGKIYYDLQFQRFYHGKLAPLFLVPWQGRNIMEEEDMVQESFLPQGSQESGKSNMKGLGPKYTF